jgi:hypothetical protein
MVIICFGFLLCLGCNLVIIGDTYVVYWFNGCCLFVGSLVHRLLLVVVWFKFVSLRSCGYSWPIRASSLVCFLLFSFVFFGFARLGSCTDSWSGFF